MTYEVKWTDTSLRNLKGLTKDVTRRIIEKVESISKEPFMFVTKLKGFDLYKLRVGDYRVIMNIERKKMVIFVVDVGHRSVIYRKY